MRWKSALRCATLSWWAAKCALTKRNDVRPMHMETATAPLLPSLAPRPVETCACWTKVTSGSTSRRTKTARWIAASVLEATHVYPPPRLSSSLAIHLAFDGLSTAFSIERPASCVPIAYTSGSASARGAAPLSASTPARSHGARSSSSGSVPWRFHVPTKRRKGDDADAAGVMRAPTVEATAAAPSAAAAATAEAGAASTVAAPPSWRAAPAATTPPLLVASGSVASRFSGRGDGADGAASAASTAAAGAAAPSSPPVGDGSAVAGGDGGDDVGSNCCCCCCCGGGVRADAMALISGSGLWSCGGGGVTSHGFRGVVLASDMSSSPPGTILADGAGRISLPMGGSRTRRGGCSRGGGCGTHIGSGCWAVARCCRPSRSHLAFCGCVVWNRTVWFPPLCLFPVPTDARTPPE